MRCPLCHGVGAITHPKHPEPGVTIPAPLHRDHRVAIQAIHLLTTEDLDLDGVSAEDISEYCDGLGAPLAESRALELIVELTGMELVQLMSWSARRSNGLWTPTVVCTENGAAIAEKLDGAA